ncbi:hypothetical protein N0V83_007713 [Neocucurbitaria cava]|uniref:Uncharacterized protein n=1 Tax=Neocucurbitaria cava TaxID=798079 RepID=A0A9W8Y4U0_9PLEO|nr:hypothetical protein N0V83_007713 [Neocucurbitaria cava]
MDDSERGAVSDTDPTSSIGSREIEKKKSQELVNALQAKVEENHTLGATVAHLQDELQARDAQYRALEKRYAVQRSQRIKDKETVDEAYEQREAMQVRCADLEEQHSNMSAQSDKTKAEHRAQLQIKDQKLSKLKNHHECAVAVLETVHKEELARKAAATSEALALIRKKDEQLEQTIREGAKDRRDIEAKLGEEKRELIKDAKINRSVWLEKKAFLTEQMERMDDDFRDSLQAQTDEIKRLTECNRRLQAENILLHNMTQGRPISAQEVQEATEVLQQMREELRLTRRREQIANEKIENTLKSMQQQRDVFDSELKKEQEAQVLANGLQKTVAELEEKLKRRNDLLWELKMPTEQLERSQPANHLLLAAATHEANALYKATFENDTMRAELRQAQKEKMEQRSELAKLDAESFELTAQLEAVEKDLNVTKDENKVLRNTRATSDRQSKLLLIALEQGGYLTGNDRAIITQDLVALTRDNQALVTREAVLHDELNSAREQIQVAKDKCDSEVHKIRHWQNYWFSAYHDEAVGKTARLYEEIRELNKELGREVHVEEHLERNVVSERAILRYACLYTLQGVDTSLIPAEYYEPGFVGCELGPIEATYDALRVLRPLGWVPLHRLGKVYLAPMYKPFTEEDAVYRLQAQEQEAHRTKIAFPAPKSMLNAKVFVEERADNITEAQKAMPLIFPNAPLPSIPVRTQPVAFKQHIAPSTPADANAKAAKGLAKQAAPLKAKPQAARRLAPVPAYEAPQAPPYRSFWQKKYDFTREQYNELDEDIKVDWINATIAPEDREVVASRALRLGDGLEMLWKIASDQHDVEGTAQQY